MNCKKVNILFDDYLNEKISGKFKSEFEDHINNCTVCKENLKLYNALNNYIENDKLNFSNSNLYDSIKSGIQKNGKTLHLITWKSKILVYAAASVIAFLSIFSGYLMGNSFSSKLIKESNTVSMEEQLFDDDLNFDLLSDNNYDYEININK